MKATRGTPKTGPRRTLQAALAGRKLPGLKRRYPVLGLPSSRFADRKRTKKCEQIT